MNPNELRSADDWAKHFKLHSCIGNKKFEAQIKQIQLNAFKAGMTEAAETPIECPIWCRESLATNKVLQLKNEAILSARDKKESL